MISDQAFILHKRSFKDSSELIKLFTANHGLIDVVGKGSRRPKSKLKGQLQSFIPTQIVFSGRGSLKNLISAEQTGVLTSTKYANHVSMLYCNELMVLLNLDVELASLLYEDYFQAINLLQKVKSVSLTLRRLEWRICQVVGYELTLPQDALDSSFLSFDPHHGLVVDNQLKLCQRHVLNKFINEKMLTNSELLQLNRLMKCVVNHIVNGKPIKSRALLMN